MALAGTLRDFSLADIFQLIGLQKKTGVLTLSNENEQARIKFMNGLVVGADTNNQKLENHLGHVLVQSNRITQDELDQVLAIQNKTLQRLGQVLIQKGFIKQEDLLDSLQIQTTQIIYRLFRWTDGEYHFQQQPFVDYDQENLKPITSESILMEGVRMLDEWPMIEKVIPNFEVVVERTPRGKAIKLHVDNEFSLEDGSGESFNSILEGVMSSGNERNDNSDAENSLPHEQEVVLKLIDGPTVVQDLIYRSGINEFETCRALYDLMGMGLVKRITVDETETSVQEEEEEHNIPIWLPSTLVAVIAIFSFLIAWNPLNAHFPTATQLEKSKNQYLASTQYRLDKIASAIDIYYIKKGLLPVSLNTLVTENLLQMSDLKDPLNRVFSYEVLIEDNRYRLFGIDYQDTSLARSTTLRREKAFSLETLGGDF